MLKASPTTLEQMCMSAGSWHTAGACVCVCVTFGHSPFQSLKDALQLMLLYPCSLMRISSSPLWRGSWIHHPFFPVPDGLTHWSLVGSLVTDEDTFMGFNDGISQSGNHMVLAKESHLLQPWISNGWRRDSWRRERETSMLALLWDA